MTSSVLDRLRGSSIVLAELLRDRGAAYRSRQKLLERRDERLRRLVAYAAETVPHYRELFADEGIDPRQIGTAGDLVHVPTVDKRTVQADPERFRSTSERGRTAVPYKTSGSTGQPLTVYVDRRSLLQNLAWAERQRIVEARLCGKRFRYREAAIMWTRSTTAQTQQFFRAASFRPLRPKRWILPIEPPLEETIAELNRIRPDVLTGYGAYLETLFRTIAARGLELQPPKVIVYVSDVMTEEGRRLIESRFGIPVLSVYNAVEAFKIGFTCEERTGFHLHEDLCVVRLLDEDGRDVGDGQSGEVVITNLTNYGTVLLNYRLGDVASFEPGLCACGRTLRRLSRLEGRLADFVRGRNGKLVSSSEITQAVTQRDGVLRYQFVQHDRDRFELRLETADPDTFARLRGPIVSDLRAMLEPTARVEATRHERIEPGPSGKHRRVFSLFDSTRDV